MESVFEAASLRVYVPETSAIPDTFFDSARTSEQINVDWEKTRDGTERDVAFFDEKLIYFLALFVPDEALGYLDNDPDVAIASLVKRIQRTMTSSFLPPTPPGSRTQPHSRLSTDPSLSHLGPPGMPTTPTTPSGGAADPTTPNPFPAMRGGEEEYADVEGVTVWEGEVGLMDSEKSTGKKDGRSFSRRVDGGFEVVWEGEVPIAYVRTQIQNPLLALTASITLRPDAVTRANHRSRASVMSVGESIHSDGEEEDGDEDDESGEAGMMDIDLLGGLAGGTDQVPATRLGPSARHDLSISDPQSGSPSSALTPFTAPHQFIPPTATSGPKRSTGELPSHLLPLGSTMRKSFRRVLSLSPGLRVRMRNLVLPQLIPLSDPSSPGENDEGDEGEKKVVLCVEIENAPDGITPPVAFTISRVDVEIGGKGGKAVANLTCQPGASGQVFPLRLQPMEQYNLLYGVTVASASEENGWEDDQAARAVLRNLGTGEVNRPVSIMVIGRPYYLDGDKEIWPTKEFSSRWNCNLDLSAYYASLAASLPPPSTIAGPSRNRTSKSVGIQPPANAIVGDKRYSLATLLAGDKEEPVNRSMALPPPKRIVSGKPLMPSQLANQAQNRISSVRSINGAAVDEKQGLMVSVRLLDGAEGGDEREKRTVRPLEEFSVEVYVNNRTEVVRRFRLSIPGRSEGKSRESMIRANLKAGVEGEAGPRQAAISSSSSPGLIPLENDVRCGPLLPGASMSQRLRFMALREGVHRIEKLRVTGVGDEVDFVVSPVLDVVVGSGIN